MLQSSFRGEGVLPGGGVLPAGGGSPWSGGGLPAGGFSLVRGGSAWSRGGFFGDPPVNRMNDRHVSKHYLGHNFVAAGNKKSEETSSMFYGKQPSGRGIMSAVAKIKGRTGQNQEFYQLY